MSLSDCKSGENEEKSEIGIWRTNNFALGPTSPKSSNGIFPTIARFNHSCLPSAEFVWNEKVGKQEIRAIRDIKAQEEISLCYFTSKYQLENVEKRKQYLLDYYGFECSCTVCSLSGKLFFNYNLRFFCSFALLFVARRSFCQLTLLFVFLHSFLLLLLALRSFSFLYAPFVTLW